jgi:hypothetical protein
MAKHTRPFFFFGPQLAPMPPGLVRGTRKGDPGGSSECLRVLGRRTAGPNAWQSRPMARVPASFIDLNKMDGLEEPTRGTCHTFGPLQYIGPPPQVEP